MKRALALALLLATGLPCEAQGNPAYTFTLTTGGRWTRTQDAYLPTAVLLRDAGLRTPEDLVITADSVWVADAGNGRILVLDRRTGATTVLGQGILAAPTGLYVESGGSVLVADEGLEAVLRLGPTGDLRAVHRRPVSPLFGTSATWRPRKLVADRRGTLSVVSEGSSNGLIQLSRAGDFLGYFGANRARLTLLQRAQDLLFTEEQRAQLFLRTPLSFANVAIDSKGILHTITQNVSGDAVKRHNTAGVNVLEASGRMWDERNFVDVAVGEHGRIFAVTETGLIYEYDASGELVFSLGGRAISTERAGLFTVASAIAVDEAGRLYVLDRERASVQVFVPTPFAELIHEAQALYDQGAYLESESRWRRILGLSGVSVLAHNGIGRAAFQRGDYALAATHFRIADNRADLSLATWEIRNAWLRANAPWLLVSVAALWGLGWVHRILRKRTRLLDAPRAAMGSLAGRPLVRDLVFVTRFIGHPVDGQATIRSGERGTVASATLLYLLLFAVAAADVLARGQLFRVADSRWISPTYLATLFFAPLLLWVVGNYAVSSISDGEGRLRDVYIGTAYAAAPYLLFAPVVVVLTHVLTLNEAFLVRFPETVLLAWCGVLEVIMVQEIHGYRMRATVRTILLTLFFMAVVVLAASILYILGDQMVALVYAVIQEVAHRVAG